MEHWSTVPETGQNLSLLEQLRTDYTIVYTAKRYVSGEIFEALALIVIEKSSHSFAQKLCENVEKIEF